MITHRDCQNKYGAPEAQAHMMTWDVPSDIEIGCVPHRLYCNRDMVAPLEKAFRNLIARGLIGEMKSFDGCFNIRKKRGGGTPSLHSWGVAIDVNAAENPFGGKPKLSPAFVACFVEAGFDWGGAWSKPDGMHFQLARLP
jgi:hypothetical protein